MNICKGCKVPEICEAKDPYESEDYFCCSDRSCYSCEYKTNCFGQCYGIEPFINSFNTFINNRL